MKWLLGIYKLPRRTFSQKVLSDEKTSKTYIKLFSPSKLSVVWLIEEMSARKNMSVYNIEEVINIIVEVFRLYKVAIL